MSREEAYILCFVFYIGLHSMHDDYNLIRHSTTFFRGSFMEFF